MNNISIKGICEHSDLDRKINLQNGSLIVQKENGRPIGIYLVISFRDNKNKYKEGDRNYCSLINLDNGQMAFEERCSRATSERRVLRHLTRAGYSSPYNPNAHDQDYKFKNMRIQVFRNGHYRMEIELGEEFVVGGTR